MFAANNIIESAKTKLTAIVETDLFMIINVIIGVELIIGSVNLLEVVEMMCLNPVFGNLHS